ncbi:MAG: hypothetical protein J6M12_09150 [Clostridia bacterium]|nr:hypothetical protein [Clostridia bacterium]
MNRKKGEERGPSKWSGGFRDAVKNSLPMRLVLFCGNLQTRAADSFFVNRLARLGGAVNERFDLSKRVIRPARIAFSKEMEQSALLYFIDSLFWKLASAPLRAYGVFWLTFVVYSLLFFVTGGYITGQEWLSVGLVVKAIIGVLAPLPLLFTSKETTLAKGLLQSRVFSFLLFDLLGLEKEPFEKKRTAVNGTAVAFLAGTLLAILGLVFSAKSLCFVAFWLLFWRLAYVSPESGMILSCLCMPVAEGKDLRNMLLVTLLMFAVKLFRGKRNLKMGVFTFFMLLYGLTVLFCGLVSPEGAHFEQTEQLLMLLPAFFLPALLFYRKEWIIRASNALSFGAIFTAVGALLVYALSFVPEEYLQMMPVLEKLGESALVNTATFGAFVAIAVPLFISRLLVDGRFKARVSSSVLLVLLFLAAVISKDPGVWIVFASAVAMMMIFKRNVTVFPLLIGGAAGAVLYCFVLPQQISDVVEGYAGPFSADFSLVARQFSESASRLFAGIGIGSGADGGNFYSRLLTEQGAAGLILLVVTAFGVLCYGISASYKNEQAGYIQRKLTGSFAVSLICTMLMGVFTDLFADEKLLFLLFFVMGSLVACAKTLDDEGARSVRASDIDRDYLFVPVIRKERKEKRTGAAKTKKALRSTKKTKQEVDPAKQAEQASPNERVAQTHTEETAFSGEGEAKKQ